jgi:hypothetical protein
MIPFERYIKTEAAGKTADRFTAMVVLKIERHAGDGRSSNDEIRYVVEYGKTGEKKQQETWYAEVVDPHYIDYFPATGSGKWEDWLVEESAKALGVSESATRRAFEEAVFVDGSSERLADFLDNEIGHMGQDALQYQEEYWAGYTEKAMDWFDDALDTRSRRYITLTKKGEAVDCELSKTPYDETAEQERLRQLKAKLQRIFADPVQSTKLLDLLETHFD